jgi:hypothetical protein
VMTPAAHASAITFTNSGNGATGEADFTFGTNTLTLVLKDTVVDPGDVGFNLSGFKFTLAGSTGGALTSSSGLERTIAGGGTFTDGSTVATGWGFTDASGAITLDDLVGGDAPQHTIVGAPGSGGTYSANSSIAGNGPHNPFLSQSATFVFTFTGGVNSDSVPTNFSWQFGTTSGFSSGGTTTPTPEPVSLSLVGGGLLAFGLFRKRMVR